MLKWKFKRHIVKASLSSIELNIESMPTVPIDTIECMRTLLALACYLTVLYFIVRMVQSFWLSVGFCVHFIHVLRAL